MGIKQFEPLWESWYTEGDPIGAGSYGTVYKAKQEMLGNTYYCAIKHISLPRDEMELLQLRQNLALDDPDDLRLYLQKEAQAQANEYDIQRRFGGSKNFVQVYDVLIQEKRTCLAMTCLSGWSC